MFRTNFKWTVSWMAALAACLTILGWCLLPVLVVLWYLKSRGVLDEIPAAPFSAPTGKFTVLKVELSRYKATRRPLANGYQWGGWEIRSGCRDSEKRLLARCFGDWWATPYQSRLRGWRQDSPIYILHQGTLVGGAYLCDKNEFSEDPDWGEIHYIFIHPSHRRQGLCSALFNHAVERARLWGLKGLVVNTDRQGLPEMYLRWGALHWRHEASERQ